MLEAASLIEGARTRTGLDDFGGTTWEEGLTRLVDALNTEATLTESGEMILEMRIGMLLANRLRITAVLDANPEIGDELVEGPLFIIGLPRTGTTALSNLVAADPQIRSVRLWESSDPVHHPRQPPKTVTRASTRLATVGTPGPPCACRPRPTLIP